MESVRRKSVWMAIKIGPATKVGDTSPCTVNFNFFPFFVHNFFSRAVIISLHNFHFIPH